MKFQMVNILHNIKTLKFINGKICFNQIQIQV